MSARSLTRPWRFFCVRLRTPLFRPLPLISLLCMSRALFLLTNTGGNMFSLLGLPFMALLFPLPRYMVTLAAGTHWLEVR